MKDTALPFVQAYKNTPEKSWIFYIKLFCPISPVPLTNPSVYDIIIKEFDFCD